MSIQVQIESKLTEQLEPEILQVLNESHMHSGPATESHFKVIVVSGHFADKRLVARHQLIYGLLAEELQGPVHALALHTYTPEEWQKNVQGAPDSPTCRGGSKSS